MSAVIADMLMQAGIATIHAAERRDPGPAGATDRGDITGNKTARLYGHRKSAAVRK